MKAFQIKVDGKLLDYRLGHKVNLNAFSNHLTTKEYKVIKLWQEKRHAVGIIEKNNIEYFVKLSTSGGINKTTQNEFLWNEKFNQENPRENSDYWVPENIDSGYFEKLYFMITDFSKGNLLSNKPIPGYEISDMSKYLNEIINFSEMIQEINIKGLEPDEQFNKVSNYQRQLSKTNMWYESIPKNLTEKHKIQELLGIVEKNINKFASKPRHGDFTPWHLFSLPNNKLLLIDGEHALSGGVQYYDIAYFIQRVFSILENKDLALKILDNLKKRNYDFDKLKTVLASRAIGGFLDRSLHENPDYSVDLEFKSLVLNL